MLSHLPTALARPLGALAVLLALAASLVVLPATAASAAPKDTCADLPLGTQVRQATAVFSGTVTSLEVQPLPVRRGNKITHEVEVDLVYKGESRVDSTQATVVTEGGTRTGCDLGRLAVGETFLFVVTTDGGTFVATGDGGTTPLTAAVDEKISEIYPNPRPPVAAEPEAATFTTLEVTQPRSLARIAAPGAAMALVGLLGLGLLRRFVRH
ncbi:hypothetical protein [Nocardioides bruguierae]|uniref:Uncharacterized protein n=1 Tax=Nocardioides bruguierae TaxID=2945102 RepID=A0A9X2IGT4_9ACTN|nr:hypothetical protein [Nocardioides bruguierae]MCM0621100.1 hypothetical protein [Nocardioides bruguierae]